MTDPAEKNDDLEPEMFVPFMALNLWSRMDEEDRMKCVWFHPKETRPVAGFFYSFNPAGYFWNA